MAAWPGEAWDPTAVLALVQVKDDQDHIASPPSELRKVPVNLTAAGLQRLRRRAEALAQEADPIAAFNEFADIEDVLEPVEAPLHDLLMYIDREIQAEIDRIRGK